MELRKKVIKSKKKIDKYEFTLLIDKINNHEKNISNFREISRRSKILEEIQIKLVIIKLNGITNYIYLHLLIKFLIYNKTNLFNLTH